MSTGEGTQGLWLLVDSSLEEKQAGVCDKVWRVVPRPIRTVLFRGCMKGCSDSKVAEGVIDKGGPDSG